MELYNVIELHVFQNELLYVWMYACRFITRNPYSLFILDYKPTIPVNYNVMLYFWPRKNGPKMRYNKILLHFQSD